MNGDDELDRLVSQLNAAPRAAGRQAPDAGLLPDKGILEDWLQHVRDLNGSDLLLVAGCPPMIRATGAITPAAANTLSSEEIEAAVQPFVARPLQVRYNAGEAVDLAFRIGGLGRFRMNLHRERGHTAAAIRALPLAIPRLRELHFTHDITALARLPRGLVLIGGPTGSGKTTTLAALVAEINATTRRHIITIEDPIEYDHPHEQSVIEQVEIGIDAPDFPTALRAAVRQAPDVIVVGEMRDPETMRIALQAAETGHLVFATVHTTDVAAAIARVADAFPTERQNAVRQELAMALAAVLTQTLVPAKNGGPFDTAQGKPFDIAQGKPFDTAQGRPFDTAQGKPFDIAQGRLVPVAELLMVSYGARQHIRKNALQHLNQEITITRKAGSFTFEESLARLVQTGVLDRADALVRAPHPEELELLFGR